MPRTSFSGDVPVVTFPYWHVCSNLSCGHLFDARKNFDLNKYLRFGITCPKCHRPAYPSRFITICEEGHLMFALSTSIVVAMLFIPMASSLFLNIEKILGAAGKAHRFNTFRDKYKELVKQALEHRKAVIIGVIVLFFVVVFATQIGRASCRERV